jgi:hypothetical protein
MRHRKERLLAIRYFDALSDALAIAAQIGAYRDLDTLSDALAAAAAKIGAYHDYFDALSDALAAAAKIGTFRDLDDLLATHCPVRISHYRRDMIYREAAAYYREAAAKIGAQEPQKETTLEKGEA